VTSRGALCRSDQLGTASLPADWQTALACKAVQSQLQTITQTIQAYLDSGAVIYPADPWYALRLTSLASVRVVILGQDPYHGPGQAQGLAFSVANAQRTPPSLRNIFAEISRDSALASTALTQPPRNDLSRWAKQGVLLLNATLTVQEGQAGSHSKLGWQAVTDALLDAVIERHMPTVYLLWGQHAQAKRQRIQELSGEHPHFILQANHPSPLSAHRPPLPFIGCGHFSQANQWLTAQGVAPIIWADEQHSDT
jgi:uracil-DNA glycosylase